LMDSELTSIASVKALNQGVATGDSPTFVDVTATSLDISGNIDVDGVTNLDVVDIDGAVDMASTLTVAGVLTATSLDISGNIDVDGTTNLDATNIVGALDVTGTATMDGLTVSASAATANITSTSGGATLNLTHPTATDGYSIRQGNANADDFRIFEGSKIKLNITTGGDISFYEDTGSTPKLFWDASAESLGIGTNSPATTLHITKDGNQSAVLDAYEAQQVSHNTIAYTRWVQNALGIANIMGVDSAAGILGTSSNHALAIRTNNTERMRIDSSGNVGIGTIDPNGFKTKIVSSAKGLFMESGNGGYTALGFTGDNGSTKGSITTNASLIYIGSENSGGTGSNGELRISPANGERLQITSAGDVKVSTGNLVIGTSGKGIDFSANGNAGGMTSEVLDSYEEGTWTSLNEVTGGNCTNIAHSDSYYTKVGRLVTLSFKVTGTITSASAETNFKFNLPFVAINSSNQGAGGTANFFIGSGSDRFGIGTVFNGTTSTATSHIYIPSSEMSNNGSIADMRVFMSYITS